MNNKTRSDVISVDIAYEEFLGTRVLDLMEVQLATFAPRWCTNLRVSPVPRQNYPASIGNAGELRDLILREAGSRGALYASLVARYGAGYERLRGGVELKGLQRNLVVYVHVDEEPFPRLNGDLILSNIVTYEVHRPKLWGRDSAAWVREVFVDSFRQDASPVWAEGYCDAEYTAKIMHDRNALAGDYSRHIRGIFWLNFFGPRYCEFIGRERLLTAPGYRVEAVGEGVLVQLHQSPHAWATEEYLATQEAVLDHIGRQYFFDRRHPDRETIAPEWPEENWPVGVPKVARSYKAIVKPGEPLRVLIDGEEFPVPPEDGAP